MDKIVLWVMIAGILFLAYKKTERLVQSMEAQDIQQTELLENQEIDGQETDMKEKN